MSKRTLAAALLTSSLLALASCRAKVSEDDLAHRYVSLAVQLGERDSDSLDFYTGLDPSIQKMRRNPATYVELHRIALALRTQLNDLPQSPRKALLLAQVDALALRTEQLQSNNRSFDDESRTLFGVVAPADKDAAQRQNLRAQIAALLGNVPYPAKAYTRYAAQFIVPANRVPAVMHAALDQCRSLTLTHMTLPPGEHVDVEFVGHKPWSAFSRYLGNAQSLIQINMDFPMTVDRALTLACHEGYPGHHVFNAMRDQALTRILHREEFTVQPTFSPQSYVSEAAASYAPLLLLSDAERLHIERQILLPLAGLKGLDCERYLQVEKLIAGLHTAEPSIARDYLDGRLEFVRAADALEREMLMENGDATLLYLNEFRTYMLAYTVGSDGVQALVEAGHPADAERWRRYLSLMTNPVVSLPAADSSGIPAGVAVVRKADSSVSLRNDKQGRF